MSADNSKKPEIDEAREARRRAEDMLAEVRQQRPEIKKLSDKASWLLIQNNFQVLIIETMGGRT